MTNAVFAAVQDDPSLTPYDSLWAAGEAVQSSGALEAAMLAQDKLYVVLAVVLIIWFGILFFILRTDRKLSRLEREIAESIGSPAHQNP